jgi:hypothetical protein
MGIEGMFDGPHITSSEKSYPFSSIQEIMVFCFKNRKKLEKDVFKNKPQLQQ